VRFICVGVVCGGKFKLRTEISQFANRRIDRVNRKSRIIRTRAEHLAWIPGCFFFAFTFACTVTECLTTTQRGRKNEERKKKFALSNNPSLENFPFLFPTFPLHYSSLREAYIYFSIMTFFFNYVSWCVVASLSSCQYYCCYLCMLV
jgi:hypothetical protein